MVDGNKIYPSRRVGAGLRLEREGGVWENSKEGLSRVHIERKSTPAKNWKATRMKQEKGWEKGILNIANRGIESSIIPYRS